ncbi:MAG: hypothetical protein ACREJU_14535 [Nitrospiraceae bacterium]
MITRITLRRPGLTLMGLLLLASAGGCSLFSAGGRTGDDHPENPPTNVPKSALPAQAPPVQKLEFDASPEGWPLKPKGRSNVTAITTTVPSSTLSAARETEIQQAALQDRRVRDLLGTRFTHINTETIMPGKHVTPAPELRRTRLTYFSYTRNMAVEVRMRGQDLETANARPGYEPPEGEEEIQKAVDLARSDGRLQRAVQGLAGHAILTSIEEGKPGYGHRVLWVTFARGDSGDPLFSAAVDLTDEKVLDAGPVP